MTSYDDIQIKKAFSILEIARMLGFDRDTITKLFENEPGVIILNRPTTMNKRRYRTMRVPHHVYERVIRRMSVR